MFIRFSLAYLIACSVFHQTIGQSKTKWNEFQRNTCPEKCILTEDSPDCISKSNMSKLTGVSDVCDEFFQGKFRSAKECKRRCYGCGAQRMLSKCTKEETGTPRGEFAICLLRPEGGLCKAYFVMWYYHVKQRHCKTFVYGGCGGNDNKFETHLECMQTCGLLAFPGEARSHNREEL